jgi:hypothetical protein
METKIKDGKLIITIDLVKTPRPSASGKNLVVATTGGFQATEALVDGQPVSVSVNATIKAGKAA